MQVVDRSTGRREGLVGGEQPLEDLGVTEAGVRQDGAGPLEGRERAFVVEERRWNTDRLVLTHAGSEDVAVVEDAPHLGQRQAESLGDVGDVPRLRNESEEVGAGGLDRP